MLETDEGFDEGDMGCWDCKQRIIRIRPGLHEQQRQQVLKHEWLHVILWDAGLRTVLSEEIEELLCDAIATALVASTLK